MPKLFVIGSGRSGTTVLMNALNTSPDVYMLGEANFVLFAEMAGFRSRFNAQHRSFGNQRTKSTYAPDISGATDSANASEYLACLESEYAWTGEKIALFHQHDLKSLKRTFETNWWGAEIIWSLRRPRFALASMKRVFSFDDLRRDINAMCQALLWFVELASTRRRVFVLPFELVEATAFEVIGGALSINFADGAKMYTAKPIDDQDFGRDGPLAEALAMLDSAYDVLLASIDRTKWIIWPSILQVEQKLPGFEPPGGSERISPFGRMVADLIRLERETRAEVGDK